MQYQHPEAIGFEAVALEMNRMPAASTVERSVNVVQNRERYFVIRKQCAELTRKLSGYRHELCYVTHIDAPPVVVVRRSSVHGFGLFANRAIAKDELISEYTGTVITSVLLADLAENVLRQYGFDSTYLFQVGATSSVIDATFAGSVARFANHSCDPNAISHRNGGRVFLLAKRDIRIGEEICYDYNLRYQPGLPRIVCMCGSSNCRKFMDFKAEKQ